MDNIQSFVIRRAEAEPSVTAFRFFQGASLIPEQLSYGQLAEQALRVAGHLRSRGLAGERVLIVCKSQQNFIVAFVACLLADAIAVPTAPPRRNALLSRLRFIVDDARAKAVVCDYAELATTDVALGSDAPLRMELGAMLQSTAAPVIDTHADSPIAFLQYTSGSTGDPKGVAVSHANVLHNCATIRDSMELSAASEVLIALPLFHDMGLVGGVLHSIFTGCVTSFLQPTEFVQYPERWLQIIGAHRITHSGGPNFMYQLAASQVTDADLAGVDLSSWRVAFCGAEPIRAATIDRFATRFATCGFRRGAFYPCYGLAEATLFVAGSKVGSPPKVCRQSGQEVVSCGVPHATTEVAIVDPSTRERVPEGAVGEIWVRSASVAQGYWLRPEISRQIFDATIAGASGCYLRTGDIGYCKHGELYVSGRSKDLIIVNGRKYAPQDLEDEAVASHAALREGGAAAFAVTRGETEQLVLVLELKREWLRRAAEAGIVGAVRHAITAAFSISTSAVVLIRPGELPRTSSGKVRRAQCRADYLVGAFERTPSNEPAEVP